VKNAAGRGSARILKLDRIPVTSEHLGVMAGLVPAIDVFILERRKRDVDARDKRGHDAESVIRPDRNPV
jgi:hypothetical protein